MPAVQSAPGKIRQGDAFPKTGGTGPMSRQSPWPTRQGDESRPAGRQKGAPSASRHAEDKQNAIAQIRRPSPLQQFFGSLSLERTFTLFGFIVAASVNSLFGLDLVCGWPFHRASLLFDATSTICGAALGYLSWDVFWDQVVGKTR